MRDLSFILNKTIAHRGLHDIDNKIYENSIEAFKRAIKKDYVIELDLHILKDNTIVVFHDNTLKRIFGIDNKIKDYTYEELSKIEINGYKICTFKEVLKLVNGKVPLIIEFKTDITDHSLERESMKILKNYKGKYVVQSFSPLIIKYFKDNYPEVIRGQLACKTWSVKYNPFIKFLCSRLMFNKITKPDFVNISVTDYSMKELKKIKKKNKYVFGWVVREKDKYDYYSKYYDNLVCEKFLTNNK